MAMKIASLGFYEEEEEDDALSAPIDHQRPRNLRPFIPEIISGGGGGGAILSLLQEKHFEQHDQTHMSSFIVVDDDGVDTTLTLSTAVSRISTPDVAVDDDEVDTNLSVFSIVSSNSIVPIYDPMPLRWFHPMMVPQFNEDSFTTPPTHKRGAAGKKRKRDGGVGKKRGKRSNNADDEDHRRPSIDEFPALVQALESRNASRAVFLYRKKLEGSDVRGDQNRLFVTRREPLMEFLTAEEAAAVDEGLVILGVDECGKPYSLGLKKWRSLNMLVINSDWNKLVAANGAGKGDVVEIWGFREDGKLGFAIIFRRG